MADPSRSSTAVANAEDTLVAPVTPQRRLPTLLIANPPSRSSTAAANDEDTLVAPVASDVTGVVPPAAAAADAFVAPVASEARAVHPAAAAADAFVAPVASEARAVHPAADAFVAPVASEAQAVLAAAATNLDEELGSQRPELEKEKLAGTVRVHERHVFLCYKAPEERSSRVEATDSDSLPRLLAAAIKARKGSLKTRTKLAIYEGEDGSESSLGDVLIFPDMIRYRGLTHSDVDNFVEEVLVKDVEWLPGSSEAIRGSYIFVCAHGSRDKRRAVFGHALITRFKEEIEGQDLVGQVAVSACSHVGGHKYPGNVIIFSLDAKGDVTGHWYGCLGPDDVPVLLHKHIRLREIVDHLWRGQVGLSKEQQRWRSRTLHLDLNSSPRQEAHAEVEPPPLPCPTSEALNNQNNSVLQPSNEATAIPSVAKDVLTPQSGRMLVVPNEYDGDAILSGSELHHYAYAKDVQKVVDKTNNWISGKLSLALLQNGKIFAVQAKAVSDVRFQENGAVCVVDNDQLPLVVTTRSLYSSSTTATLSEHKPEKSEVLDIKIMKSEFGGKLWLRRKYSIEGDDLYHVLQWKPRKPDHESKVKLHVKTKRTEDHVAVGPRKESEAERAVEDTVDDYSIKTCINISNKIQELSVDEKARACDIFRIDQNREIFVCADPATRLVWLRKQMAIPD